MSNLLPQPFGALHAAPIWFHHAQRPIKLSHREMARSDEEEQGLPVSAMQQEPPQFPGACSADYLSTFHH